MNSKYDMRINPVYQIDWAAAASGKRVSATKRRVRFRFGFSNRASLAQGLTGTECRGEEHEVSLIWSLTSGKRLVAFDGKEVHFSMGRRGEGKFEASWSIPCGHMMKIIAHATPPLCATPGFKQFDLLLDGMSFFEMPHIFELGVQNQHGIGRAAAMIPSSSPDNAFAYKNFQAEEKRNYPTTVRHLEEEQSTNSYHSLDHARQGFAGPTGRTTVESAPVVVAARPDAMPSIIPQDVLSESPSLSDLLEAPTSTFANTVDEFTPVVVKPQPPTFQDVSNQILGAYGPAPTPPAPLALANESHTHHMPVQAPAPYYHHHQQQQQFAPPAAYTPHHQQTNYAAPHPATVSPSGSTGAHAGFYAHQAPHQQPLVVDPNAPQQGTAPVVTPTMMKPLDVDELRDSPPPSNPMDLALQTLVNLDDLKETMATPEQIKAKKQKEAAIKSKHKSSAKPPAATDWHVGQNASLADIQKHKKNSAPLAKEIMKTHAFDPAAAQSGMMVVYGQQAPFPAQGGFAGGIPAATGFGVGAYRGYPQSVRMG